MPLNKSALTRYRKYDELFRQHRKYSSIEILDKFEYYDIRVSRRQFYLDIEEMTYIFDGFEENLEKSKDGRTALYTYKDKDYTILSSSFNQRELYFQILDIMKSETKERKVVEFEVNRYYEGISEHFGKLYDLIVNKQVINLFYRDFNIKHPREILLHPYRLKEYNNRWFLVGLDANRNKIFTFPLDRIVRIDENKTNEFIEPDEDFDEFFEDVIGVTVNNEQPVTIELKISKNRYPYIETKPIHASQTPVKERDGSYHTTLRLIPNPEFYSQILSFGEDVEVVSPAEIRETIKNKVASMMQSYNN
jgi:predicted DNA-binding transcriptional regulator YafY